MRNDSQIHVWQVYGFTLQNELEHQHALKQWSQTQFLEGHSSAEFSSNQLQVTLAEVSSNPEDLD